jgi:LPXTG-site transpeptidase (sortase) family protein
MSTDKPTKDLNDSKAFELIKQRLGKIYSESPSIIEEQKVALVEPNQSPHQQFIKNLTSSNKSMAEIQTEWHNYYIGLPDNEKFKVWQEFYETNEKRLELSNPNQEENLANHKTQIVQKRNKLLKRFIAQPNNYQNGPNNHRVKHFHFKTHLKSLIFGLSIGFLAIFIFLFSFFNQVIITPFIQPSSVIAATPIILTGNNQAPTSTPEVIIPKINVQIPVHYNVDTTDEYIIENNLETGVVHFPTTVLPGQNGNAVYFGHSANNILNPGKYKFAFVLLHTLVDGDTFYLTYNDKIYTYKVISHFDVSPNDVGVLGPVPGQTATATLITCDPPGTSLYRLIVIGKQISPNPNTNTTPTTTTNFQIPKTLPNNGPSLFSTVFSSLTNKIIGIAIALVFVGLAIRWLYSFKD